MEVARCSSRRPLRIAPFSVPQLDEVRAKSYMKAVQHALQMAWKCRTSEISFPPIDHVMYRLVICKQGEKLYDLFTSFVRRASLCMREKQFLAFSNTADTLHFHVEHTYVLAQKRTPLMEYARVMYNRRVAYLWRRVRYVAVKGARITLRREEFDELRFQPGGSGWLAARKSFNAHANASRAPSASGAR